MLTSFLLSNTPGALMLVGGIAAAIGILHMAIAVPGTGRPSRKGATALAAGLAALFVMLAWNDVLSLGFEALGVDQDAALAVAEGGNLGDDIVLAGKILIVTLLAIAVCTVAVVIVVNAIQRIVLSRPSPQPEAQPTARRNAPVGEPAEGTEPPPLR